MKMRSRKKRSTARRSGSGRNHKRTASVDACEQPTRGSALHVATEQDIAAEAPDIPEPETADTEEAQGEVEFPEAVVLIGKTHWRCVTCMVLHPRASSIDEHVNIHHKSPDSSLALPSFPERGQDREKAVSQSKTVIHVSKESELDSELKVLEPSAHPTEDAEMENTANKKEALHSDSRPIQKGTGNVRGGTRRGGGRGRGRVFTKPPTCDDSDTEVETPALTSPVKALPEKRKIGTTLGPANEVDVSTDAQQVETDMATGTVEPGPPSNKMAKHGETNSGSNLASPCEPAVEDAHVSVEHVPRDALKDQMKEKYVVFVGKSGSLDYSLDTEGHMDCDPPLPIETPSLQADAFLPPATPLLPDIHGPPETPVAPETPHPPEVLHQPELFHPDHQESVMLSPGIVSDTLTSEHLSRSEGLHTEQPLMSGNDFSSDGVMTSKSSDKEFASATVCMTCGAAFESPEELRLHREEMVKFDIVSCNSCGDKFHGLHQLNIHVFTTHERFAKKFCFLCDVDCLDRFELEEHLLEHTSVETDVEEDVNILESVQHTCKKCGTEVEGNLSDLVNHYHTTHDQFVCTKCYKLFTDLMEYEDHKMLHCTQADVAVVYSCPVSDCFQLCEDKEALMNHISWHEDRDIDEEQQSLLQCHYCSDHFRNIISMQRHLADTHNEPDLRPFVCELCKEAFSHSLELHKHNALRHAGLKRYGCAYCDQCFAFRSAHRRHVASEHDVAATVLHM